MMLDMIFAPNTWNDGVLICVIVAVVSVVALAITGTEE